MKPRYRIYYGNKIENYLYAVNTPAKLYVAEKRFRLWDLMDKYTKELLKVFGCNTYFFRDK